MCESKSSTKGNFTDTFNGLIVFRPWKAAAPSQKITTFCLVEEVKGAGVKMACLHLIISSLLAFGSLVKAAYGDACSIFWRMILKYAKRKPLHRSFPLRPFKNIPLHTLVWTWWYRIAVCAKSQGLFLKVRIRPFAVWWWPCQCYFFPFIKNLQSSLVQCNIFFRNRNLFMPNPFSVSSFSPTCMQQTLKWQQSLQFCCRQQFCSLASHCWRNFLCLKN